MLAAGGTCSVEIFLDPFFLFFQKSTIRTKKSQEGTYARVSDRPNEVGAWESRAGANRQDHERGFRNKINIG